jgi:hypothetical protein
VPAGGGPVGGFIEAVAKKLNIDIKEATRKVNAWATKNGAITEKNAKKAFAALTTSPFVEPVDKGGTGDGSSSSSGGSSGGSSGSGSVGPTPEQIANAKASFANMVLAWGIPVDKAMSNFIDRAVMSGMGSSTFLKQLRATKVYAQTFPGLIKKDGTLRMSEAQYIAGFQAAKDYAAQVGRNFSKGAYGMALKTGNSPSEIKTKLEALDSLKTNGALLNEFSDYLVARGVTKKPLNKQEMLAFVMKQGPKAWEQEWEIANQSAAIEKATEGGILVGKPALGNDVSYKELDKLRKGLLPGEEPDMQALASVMEAMPASRLYKLGLNKKDALTLAYNGPGAKEIAKRAQLALGTAQAAATEQRANPQLTKQGMDMGSPRTQATE